jgi:hypothetical protein
MDYKLMNEIYCIALDLCVKMIPVKEQLVGTAMIYKSDIQRIDCNLSFTDSYIIEYFEWMSDIGEKIILDILNVYCEFKQDFMEIIDIDESSSLIRPKNKIGW